MVGQRLALGLLTLFVISLVIFGALELLPGDLAQEILGQSATPETVAAFRRELGLDLPPHERYLDWLGGVLTGDFGNSLANGRPVAELIGTRLGNTLFLAFYAALIAVPLSLALGILAALFRNSWYDRAVNVFTLSSISFPEFFVAYIYILIFYLAQTGYFPSISNISPESGLGERLYRGFLPALTLTLVVTAHMMRMTRASIINLLASPYIEMARLKGHIASAGHRASMRCRTRSLQSSTSIALNLAYLITGVVVVEVVFVYPGIGQLFVDCGRQEPRYHRRCRPAALIFAGGLSCSLNLLADVMSIAFQSAARAQALRIRSWNSWSGSAK